VGSLWKKTRMKIIWIGIDTGGTFTDLMLADLTTGMNHDH
jgi:N-methylhydantoinase A/oxoprolinase/acetone carboxylase beta subunit